MLIGIIWNYYELLLSLTDGFITKLRRQFKTYALVVSRSRSHFAFNLRLTSADTPHVTRFDVVWIVRDTIFVDNSAYV